MCPVTGPGLGPKGDANGRHLFTTLSGPGSVSGLFFIMTRSTLSKSLRFKIFTRDNFACRYCGRQSDVVKLVIDHVIPICQGGTSDPENLITACEECNSGKGSRTIEQALPADSDRLRRCQEYQEQLQLCKAAIAMRESRAELRQILVNEFCEAFQRSSMGRTTANILMSYVEEQGFDTVLHWIDIAQARLPAYSSDQKIGKYISGIRRNFKTVEQEPNSIISPAVPEELQTT